MEMDFASGINKVGNCEQARAKSASGYYIKTVIIVKIS